MFDLLDDVIWRDEIDRQAVLDDAVEELRGIEDPDDQFSYLEHLDIDLNDADLDYIQKNL